MIWVVLIVLALACVGWLVLAIEARATARRYRQALVRIYDGEGKVCRACTEGIDSSHGGCLSSQRAWDVAEEALHPEVRS